MKRRSLVETAMEEGGTKPILEILICDIMFGLRFGEEGYGGLRSEWEVEVMEG